MTTAAIVRYAACAMRVLLVTPPMTQLNTPYPATAYLTGFLRMHAAELGLAVTQADASLGLFLRLYSAPLVERMADELGRRASTTARGVTAPPPIAHFLAHAERYVDTVEPAIRFLQRRDPSLALRIVGRAFLPEGPRFAHLSPPPTAELTTIDEQLFSAFGTLGTTEQARYLASLYVDDLADVWRDGIDPRFELARYGERLAASAASFEPLRSALEGEPTLVDATLDELTRELVAAHEPDVVAVTAPFPGNVYGAFRIARTVRAAAPKATLVLGGGWVNTELRSLREPRVFDYFDYVTLDDGERPLLNLLARLRGKRAPLVRTYVRKRGEVALETDATQHDIPQRDTGIPTYDGLHARALRVRHGDAEPDASALVGRPLEQDHARPRLLLEEVHVLRRLARLHRPLRPPGRRRRDAAHPRAHCRDRRNRLPPRRRSRAAGRDARTRETAPRREAQHHVVGQHPLREDFHSGALPAARRRGLRGRERRARGRVRSAARSHEEGRHGRAGRARDARVHRCRRHGARVS